MKRAPKVILAALTVVIGMGGGVAQAGSQAGTAQNAVPEPSAERGNQISERLVLSASPESDFSALSDDDKASVLKVGTLTIVPRATSGKAKVAPLPGGGSSGDPAGSYVTPVAKSTTSAWPPRHRLMCWNLRAEQDIVFTVKTYFSKKDINIGGMWLEMYWCHNGKKASYTKVTGHGGWASFLNSEFTDSSVYGVRNMKREARVSVKYNIRVDYKIWHQNVIRCMQIRGRDWGNWGYRPNCNLMVW